MNGSCGIHPAVKALVKTIFLSGTISRNTPSFGISVPSGPSITIKPRPPGLRSSSTTGVVYGRGAHHSPSARSRRGKRPGGGASIRRVIDNSCSAIGSPVMSGPCSHGSSRGRLASGHGGLRRGDIHPHPLPDVPVRVLEAATVHEAVILLRAG